MSASGGGAGLITGEVATFADLPTSTVTAPVGSYWIVQTSTGVWLVNRRPKGLYRRIAGSGTLATDYEIIDDYPVDSVNGKVGTVVVNQTDVGLGNVDNTSDANKPVSTAQQTALNLKANLAGPTFTGTVGGITKSMVGLGSVDNTADAAKNVLSATKLTTARNINGVPFDGTADISITAAAGAFDGIMDEFLGTLRCGINANGSGSSVNISATSSTAARQGILTGNMGTTTTGRAMYGGIGGNTGGSYVSSIIGARATVFEVMVMIPVLSDGTDTFLFMGGFLVGASGTSLTVDHLAFAYSHGNNGGRWEMRSRLSGTNTLVDSGVTVVAGTWYKLRIEVNSAGTTIQAYLDGTPLTPITTNIPTAAGSWSIGATKSLGTTARVWRADYYMLQFP